MGSKVFKGHTVQEKKINGGKTIGPGWSYQKGHGANLGESHKSFHSKGNIVLGGAKG